MVVATRMVKYWIKNISRNIGAVWRNKMTPVALLPWQQFHRWPFFNQSVCLNQAPSTPSNLMRRVKTIWEPCLFRARPSVALKMVGNGDIWFWQKETGAKKMLTWQWHHRCHFVSFVIYSSGAKFEDYCSNISRDILQSVFYHFSCIVYYVIHFLICIIQKR